MGVVVAAGGAAGEVIEVILGGLGGLGRGKIVNSEFFDGGGGAGLLIW